MGFPRATAFALLLLLGVRLAAAEAPAMQVDPGADLASLYPRAGHVGMAIAIVPDPHVPRYRRLFDLEVQAITLGMLHDGYVLDRYAFPWSGTVSDAGAKATATGEKTAASKATPRGAFGLMIFRCDGWRGRSCAHPAIPQPAGPTEPVAPTSIRAIYFVTDSATWGVDSERLVCAARRLREQVTGVEERIAGVRDDPEAAISCPQPQEARLQERASRPRVGLLQFPGCPAGGGRRSLVLLGPNFSGAIDPVGQHLEELRGSGVTDVCLVSGFTSVGSNQRAPLRYDHLHYVRLALDDGFKLLALADLAKAYDLFDPGRNPEPSGTSRPRAPAKPRRDVAFLTEASTFGYGVCIPSATLTAAERQRVQEFCADAQTLYFPAAIADIRYGLDQQRERLQNEVQSAMQAALPSEHLALDVGAENGSEFPENRQSRLTAASQQLALDHVLNRLEQSEPRMVVVVATDVRDRLFLFDQLRQRLPSALLIDLETDVLLAHPDFLHASRGAVTLASANLFVRGGRVYGCERDRGRSRVRVPLASWAVDGQGMLSDAVSRLDEAVPPLSARPCIDATEPVGPRRPVFHVVTLKGLRQISRAFDHAAHPSGERAQIRVQRQRDLCMAQWMGFFAVVVVALPWISMRTLQRSAALTRHLPSALTALVAVASAISWIFAMRAAYAGPDPESGYSLMYWSAALLVLAMAGLRTCVRRLQECCPIHGEMHSRYRRTVAVAGTFACAVAAVPALSRLLARDDGREVLDDDLVTRLGLDVGQGLAYHVVSALGVVAVLLVLVVLATGGCIMARDNHLLSINGRGNDCDAGARTPDFPRAAVGIMALLIVFLAVPSLTSHFGGSRLSIFGPTASLIATLVLVLTTLGASILTVVAVHASRRIRAMAAHISRCVSPPAAGDPKDAPEAPGLWPPCEWQPNLFAATPIMARVSPGIVGALNRGTHTDEHTEKSWATLVGEFLGRCDGGARANGGLHRRAVYALLASEISLYRWFVGGAVLCAVGGVCAAYLFPLEADPLILWNLGVLIVHALLAGYVATAFERDGVLSNILCNRPKKAAFSASLFAYAAAPFLALGFAIAVSQVPGVVDWGGGVLALLGAIGVTF